MMNRDEAAEFIQRNVVGSKEAQEYLMINRRRLSALVEAGKLLPVKVLKRENLYWQHDLEVLRSALLSDSRSNLYKNVTKNSPHGM